GLATDFGISVDPDAAPAPAAVSTPSPAISLKKQQLINLDKKLASTAPAMLSLTKKAAVSLEKRGLGEHTARVALCLDISGSMNRLYRNGSIAKLAERVLALGLRFDDDGQVDVFLFGRDGHQAGALQLDNRTDYVPSMLKQFGLEPATYYGKAMALIRQHYFGSAESRREPRADTVPVYVMFVTDGQTFDEDGAREQVISSSYEPLFWQFMAIGASARTAAAPAAPGRPSTGLFGKRRAAPAGANSEFRFLEELDDMAGRYVDNADFFAVEDPAAIADDELFELLMTEYPGWLTQARAKGLLR
ncbi:MAG: VWA domain-containing protein, partial [Actinomycetota bacterium]|nr:VWA domain-containing protein [Actinomycetota bacterium]